MQHGELDYLTDSTASTTCIDLSLQRPPIRSAGTLLATPNTQPNLARLRQSGHMAITWVHPRPDRVVRMSVAVRQELTLESSRGRNYS